MFFWKILSYHYVSGWRKTDGGGGGGLLRQAGPSQGHFKEENRGNCGRGWARDVRGVTSNCFGKKFRVTYVMWICKKRTEE